MPSNRMCLSECKRAQTVFGVFLDFNISGLIRFCHMTAVRSVYREKAIIYIILYYGNQILRKLHLLYESLFVSLLVVEFRRCFFPVFVQCILKRI